MDINTRPSIVPTCFVCETNEPPIGLRCLDNVSGLTGYCHIGPCPQQTSMPINNAVATSYYLGDVCATTTKTPVSASEKSTATRNFFQHACTTCEASFKSVRAFENHLKKLSHKLKEILNQQKKLFCHEEQCQQSPHLSPLIGFSSYRAIKSHYNELHKVDFPRIEWAEKPGQTIKIGNQPIPSIKTQYWYFQVYKK